MLKIDMHTHLLPSRLPDFKNQFGYGGFIQLRDCDEADKKDMVNDSGKFFRRVEANLYDLEARENDFEKFNIDMQVISTVPVMMSYWAKPQDALKVSQFLNDHIADAVCSRPHRYLGLGTVPLQDVKLAIAEAKRCKKDLNLSGLQIGSNVNQVNLSDRQFDDFFATCEAEQIPLMVHPWEMMGQEHMQKYWLPWLVGMPAELSRAICSMMFGGVFDRFPGLRVLFAHGGGAFPFTLGRIEHGFEVRPDLCAIDSARSPREQIKQIWFDALLHDSLALKYLYDLVGAKKICMGTDYPFPLGELVPGQLIKEMNFTQTEQEQMLSLSTLDWLGVNIEQLKKMRKQ